MASEVWDYDKYPWKEEKIEPRTNTGVEFSLPSDTNHVYRVNIINRGNGNPDHISYAEGALANYVIPSVEDTKSNRSLF